MAFDRSNSADLLALKNEMADDPINMDYAAAAGETQIALSKLNSPAENVGGGSINRPTEELDIPDIAGVIDAAEFALLSEYDKDWVRMFINKPADALLKPYQGKFVSLFAQGSKTLAATLALRSKPASRAEVLFGVNTIITKLDYVAARDS